MFVSLNVCCCQTLPEPKKFRIRFRLLITGHWRSGRPTHGSKSRLAVLANEHLTIVSNEGRIFEETDLESYVSDTFLPLDIPSLFIIGSSDATLLLHAHYQVKPKSITESYLLTTLFLTVRILFTINLNPQYILARSHGKLPTTLISSYNNGTQQGEKDGQP